LNVLDYMYEGGILISSPTSYYERRVLFTWSPSTVISCTYAKDL